MVVQKAVLAVYKTNTYSFSKKYFLQMKGGPTELRSTCCIHRLVVIWWDEKFLEVWRGVSSRWWTVDGKWTTCVPGSGPSGWVGDGSVDSCCKGGAVRCKRRRVG